jgi:hypothetical protein
VHLAAEYCRELARAEALREWIEVVVQVTPTAGEGGAGGQPDRQLHREPALCTGHHGSGDSLDVRQKEAQALLTRRCGRVPAGELRFDGQPHSRGRSLEELGHAGILAAAW